MTNMLGMQLQEINTSDNIDQPMSPIEKQQAWRMAMFHGRCENDSSFHEEFGMRRFCKTCCFIVFHTHVLHATICPCCITNESWEIIGNPCLTCQCAAMVYRNPFNLRYKRQLDIWLSPIDTDESELSQMELPCTLTTKSLQTDNDMLIRCTKNIEHSFQEINSKATPDQTRIIFESLSKLQNDIQNNHAISKRSHASQELTDTKDKNEDEFTSPK
jgi:hypothetical protein